MTRIKQDWRLTKDSWAVLKADRSLALFPLLSLAASVIAFVLLIAPGVGAAVAAETAWPVIPFFLIASYAATFAAVYFNVALAGATVQAMAGKDTRLSDGLAVASGAARPVGGSVGR